MSCPQILPFNCCLASAHKVPWAYSYQLHWTVASSLYTYAVPLLFITTLLLPAYLLCHADSWLSNVSAFYDLVPKAGTSNDSYWFHKSLLYLLNNLLCSTALICLFFWTLPKTISSTRLGLMYNILNDKVFRTGTVLVNKYMLNEWSIKVNEPLVIKLIA